jgi:colanic acid biosynthesis protein WcaH
LITDSEFSCVVRCAPLPSIDLIIRDSDRRVLVGLRTNEPAKNYYFVPGGVIRKNETIELAFARILRAETGCRASHGDARFFGAFQHFYPTNRFGDPAYGTHYVFWLTSCNWATALQSSSMHSTANLNGWPYPT